MPQYNPAKSQYDKDCYLTDELRARMTGYTPDWLELKQYKNIPVFVYGQMKQGGSRNKVFEDAIYLGEAYTSTGAYLMERSEYDFPVVFDTKNVTQKSRKIAGECYLVDPLTMLSLDSMECNGEIFYRQGRYIYLHDQAIIGKNDKMLRPSIKAWMYLGVYGFWEHENTNSMKACSRWNHELFEFDTSIQSSLFKDYKEELDKEDKERREDRMWKALEDESQTWEVPDFIKNPVPF